MKRIISFFIIATFLVLPLQNVLAGEEVQTQSKVAERVQGRIVLQVQENGEAWYINPADQKRYYLGRPGDAFDIMRYLSLGITDTNLAKVPRYNSDDVGDQAMVDRVKGKILLQVEEHGEAWYVSPVNGKRYYMGRPADAFQLMRNLGLGINDKDLDTITIGTTTVKTSDGTDAVSVRNGDANVILEGNAQADGVHLSWSKSNRGENFKYYKVVRSKTNDNPTYSEDGHIKAISNINDLVYTDTSAKSAQNYYYRVCVLYNNNSAGALYGNPSTSDSSYNEECSNVIQVTGDTDGTTSDDSDLQAPTLTASLDGSGMHMSWSKNSESNFKYYKVVRSQTNSNPVYPTDGYIHYSSSSNSYTDSKITNQSSGTYYYRICSVNDANEVFCSNVITVKNGSVQ
ncbi:hypothetical protein KKH43_02820 [Patescibacteria group bacterium]|nr:hypothetical protein [Patescibacteria group bacterium]